MAKQARMAENFFFARRAWRVWTDKFEEKQRQRKLWELETCKMQKYFLSKF
jgi:hypothetical protein